MAVDDDFRSVVRLKSGDAGATQILSDDDIDLLIDGMTSSNLAAAEVADALSAKFSKSVTFSVEGLSIQNSVKADNYRKLAQRLRTKALLEGASIDSSPLGISKDAMAAIDDDTDRTDSKFKVGMHDLPGADTTPETQK